jgi:hypothetical protein
MQTSIFSKDKLSKGTLRNFQSLCSLTSTLGIVPTEDENLVDLILEKENELQYETKAKDLEAERLIIENKYLSQQLKQR